MDNQNLNKCDFSALKLEQLIEISNLIHSDLEMPAKLKSITLAALALLRADAASFWLEESMLFGDSMEDMNRPSPLERHHRPNIINDRLYVLTQSSGIADTIAFYDVFLQDSSKNNKTESYHDNIKSIVKDQSTLGLEFTRSIQSCNSFNLNRKILNLKTEFMGPVETKTMENGEQSPSHQIDTVKVFERQIRAALKTRSFMPKHSLCRLLDLYQNGDQLGVLSILRQKESGDFSFEDKYIFNKLAEAAQSALRNYFHLTIMRQKLRQSVVFQKENKIPEIIGQSENIDKLKKLILQIAPSHIHVLIEGERGTGKELVAESIHRFSDRSQGALIRAHCAGMASSLLESELFGHEKGAFTGSLRTKKGLFEMAHNGTLFLDEIGEMSEELQIKMLRAIQEGRFRRVGGEKEIRVNVRLVSATNKPVSGDQSGKILRRDLYDRLAGIVLTLPPLRDRDQDAIILAEHFIDKYSLLENKPSLIGMSVDVKKFILTHQWPGNVRELQNFIHRSMILSTSNELEINDNVTQYSKSIIKKSDSKDIDYQEKKNDTKLLGEFGLICEFDLKKSYRDIKKKLEREYLQALMALCHGNLSQAGRVSGLDRNNIRIKIKRHKVQL